MELLILLILAAIVRAPFVLQGINLFDFDEATFALMAQRLLEGELSLFISGHSYSGSFISFIAAPFIAIFGNTVFPIKLTTLLFFLSFIAVNYSLLKKITNKSVAVFATLLLIFMPPAIFDVSLRFWGGHAALWVFQAGVLVLLYQYFDGPSKFFNGRLLFFIGILSGCALWMSEMVVLFLVPFALYFFLRNRKPKEDSIFSWVLKFFKLSYFRLPKNIRLIFQCWHWFLLFFIFIHLFSLVIANSSLVEIAWLKKTLKIFGAIPPFQMKTMFKVVFAFSLSTIALYVLHAKPFSKLLIAGNLGPLLGGLLAGYFPALLFNVAGGEGLRIFQKSGILGPEALWSRASLIFTQKIPQFIFGFGDTYYSPVTDLQQIGAWCFLSITVIGLVVVIFKLRKDWMVLFQPTKYKLKPSYICIFFFVIILTLIANLGSTLEAARYLAPIYLSIAVILGFFFGKILWQNQKWLSIVLLLTISLHSGFSTYQYYKAIPLQRGPSYVSLIDYLQKNDIQGGHASRTVSHILTYLSGEDIVLSTYLQKERYLPHEEYTRDLNNKAYVFETDDSTAEFFRNNPDMFPKVTNQKEFGRYVAYLVQEKPTEIDKSYEPREHKFPISLYLNE